VVTAGAWGSTHALATALAVRKLGGHAVLLLWPQEMNPTAERIRRESAAAADEVHDVRGVVSAYARGLLGRSRGARWIPPGGGTPLGALGFVNAALELAAQVRAGVLPAPARIVVPLGTGGTTAGLLVGLELAGLPSRVIAARVVPRIVANRGHVLWLAWRTAHLLRKLSGADVPSPRGSRLEIVQDVYGGAYGRETERGREAAERYRAWSGRPLDPTYSAKALAAALALPEGGPTLFWLTYDARMARPASPRATP
jgi:D-cysteine desulfhydrase